jgi:hypothetical protein
MTNMIADDEIAAKFERDLIAGSKLKHSQALRIFESLGNSYPITGQSHLTVHMRGDNDQ